MAMIPALASERLQLNPFTHDDIEGLVDLWTAAPMREHLWEGKKITYELAQSAVREATADAGRSGIGMWTLRLGRDPILAGFCGFRWLGIPPQIELLYGLRPDLWGVGLASEAVRTCLAWLFENHPVDYVLAGTSSENPRSLQLLTRLGFEAMAQRPAGPDTIDYFQLSRENFRP